VDKDTADNNWHLKKEVSVSHIISTVMLAGLMVSGWVDVQNRLSETERHLGTPSHASTEIRLDLIERNLTQVEATDRAVQKRIEDLHQEILRSLARQNDKLDRIEDRLNANRGNSL